MKQKVQLISAAAGFPSPAENYIEEQLNLNKRLISDVKNYKKSLAPSRPDYHSVGILERAVNRQPGSRSRDS